MGFDELRLILLIFLNLIPAWISNHMPVKCGMKLLIHSQTSIVQLLKLGMDK